MARCAVALSTLTGSVAADAWGHARGAPPASAHHTRARREAPMLLAEIDLRERDVASTRDVVPMAQLTARPASKRGGGVESGIRI